MHCLHIIAARPSPTQWITMKRNVIQKEQGTNTPNCCAYMTIDPSTKRDLPR